MSSGAAGVATVPGYWLEELVGLEYDFVLFFYSIGNVI